MSRPIFLTCPQLTYDRISRGSKEIKFNPMINVNHLIEVTPIGESNIDFDTDGNHIKNSFKYRIYFYTVKGDLNWYFDTLESMEEWVKCFYLQYGDILKK